MAVGTRTTTDVEDINTTKVKMEIEIQPRDTSKGHFYVSVVKSAVRIGAGTALIMGSLAVCGWLLILAEILGVVEEVV